MKTNIFEKTIVVAEDLDGNNIRLTAQIDDIEDEQETIVHTRIKNYKVLHISGYSKNYGGQIYDELKPEKIKTYFVPQEVVEQIVKIWKEWHLNDLHAGCFHQGEVDCNHEDWKEKQAVETAKCPEKYVYGSKWLVAPLPEKIEKQVKELFT